MADKKCPVCGLWNMDSALLCDCGYDFEQRIIKEPRNARPLSLVSNPGKFLQFVTLLLGILLLPALLIYSIQLAIIHPDPPESMWLFNFTISKLIQNFLIIPGSMFVFGFYRNLAKQYELHKIPPWLNVGITLIIVGISLVINLLAANSYLLPMFNKTSLCNSLIC